LSYLVSPLSIGDHISLENIAYMTSKQSFYSGFQRNFQIEVREYYYTLPPLLLRSESRL